MELSILFGRPWSPQTAPDLFEYEADAADELGIEYAAIPLEPIVNLEPERALSRLPRGPARRWLYRGWMLNEEEYEGLFEAVLERGDLLVTQPNQFAAALYIPEYVPQLGHHTPATRWTWGEDAAEAWDLAQELGPPPWIIKDHVKSAKERWLEACYVPEGVTRERFMELCGGLIDARGDRFERGIVIREYLKLKPVPYRAPDRQLYEEHRLVFWEGALIAHAPYHDVASAPLDPRPFEWIGARIDSPFFTADVARLASGGWTVIELNDGGVSTLPDQLDPRDLYRAILAREAEPFA